MQKFGTNSKRINQAETRTRPGGNEGRKENNVFMVYFKGANDKHHRPMNIASGELFDRLAFAPIYRDELLPDVIRWIEQNKECAPECSIQCRAPGTAKIIYA